MKTLKFSPLEINPLYGNWRIKFGENRTIHQIRQTLVLPIFRRLWYNESFIRTKEVTSNNTYVCTYTEALYSDGITAN